MKSLPRLLLPLLAPLLTQLCLYASAHAEEATVTATDAEPQRFMARFQTTYVGQSKPALRAAYSGPNSLSADAEHSYSFTATAFLGARLWQGGELYFNPEAAQGVALSNLTGLGGFSNGEMARTSGPSLTFYRARLFLRQTWNLGGGSERLEADDNQLAGSVGRRRFVLTAGNLSVTDLFDDNAYSHDPRTQFLNWSIMTHGAYDYAADARGYTWGIAGEYFAEGWALRAGRFALPEEPNGQPLDFALARHYGDQIEFERAHQMAGQPGKLRLLWFRNRTVMARFDVALSAAGAAATPPDLSLVRSGERSKLGWGINLEQALGDNAGACLRVSKADGKSETYAFTEIDQSVSGGLLFKGGAWGRGGDSAGIAFARNGLSAQRRAYLAAGGISFFLGDGALNYATENIVEAFCSWQMLRGLWLSADFQHIANPGYNADRGPTRFAALRLHAEF